MGRLADWLIRVLERVPLVRALILSGAVYLTIGVIVPLMTSQGRAGLVISGVCAALWAWVITVAALWGRVQAAQRRHLLDWTTNLRLLSATEFEWLVGELLRREGWTVEETGGDGAADGNIDLRIRRGKQERVVQCKRWESWSVGVDEVRKLAGTVARERLPRDSGILVTLSRFTDQAMAEAREADVELVDNDELVRRIEAVRQVEPCPICATAMILDRSNRGWWLRCPRYAEGCRGKRDLSGDPGRAVELLVAHP